MSVIAAGRQLEPEGGEEPGETGRRRDARRQPEHDADDADDERLGQHGGEHVATPGADEAQQRQLAGALGHGDREGVEDDERADEHGHEGEREERRGEDGEPVAHEPGVRRDLVAARARGERPGQRALEAADEDPGLARPRHRAPRGGRPGRGGCRGAERRPGS